MADYKDMYYRLFGKVANAIEMLQVAQMEVEDMYIKADEPKMELKTKEQSDTSESK